MASPDMDECSCTTLIFSSFTGIPLLECVDPNYLIWSTASSTFPFIHMLVDSVGLMLLTRILLLSMLISIPYHGVVFSSLLVSCWECFFVASQKIDVISQRIAGCKPVLRQWTMKVSQVFCIIFSTNVYLR